MAGNGPSASCIARSFSRPTHCALGVMQDDFVLSWLPNGLDALLVVVRAQLPRRGICADQHRLPRPHSGAGGGQIPARACWWRMPGCCRGSAMWSQRKSRRSSPWAAATMASARCPSCRRRRSTSSNEPRHGSTARSSPRTTQSVIYTSGTTGPSKGPVDIRAPVRDRRNLFDAERARSLPGELATIPRRRHRMDLTPC